MSASTRPSWLPGLLLFEEYGGSWREYEDALYDVFRRDFVDTTATFQDWPIRVRREPWLKGKEWLFWHITDKDVEPGSGDEERIPDFRRCERLPWIRPMIEHSTDPALRVWEEQRAGDQRAHLWLEHQDFLVVLARRRGYWMLWTAFYIDSNGYRAQLRTRSRRPKS
jgi:hypothetical protein